MRRKTIIGFLCLFYSIVFAQTDGTSGASSVSSESTREMPAHLDGTFRQVRESSMLAAPQVMTGVFLFDAPDKVTWTYDTGATATLPEPILKFIGGAVKGTFLQQNDDFDVQETRGVLILTPKKKRIQKLFSSIKITLNESGIAEQVVMNEPSGDITTIDFSWR